MELLMDNLRAVLHRKNSGDDQVERIEEEQQKKGLGELAEMALKAAVILGASFVAARVPFFFIMYPCGIALFTVLMARGREGIYAILPVLAGLFSAAGVTTEAIGGAAATLVCGVLFLALRRREISLTARAMLAAAVCVAVKTSVAIGLHSFYTYDGFSVLGEGLLVLFFVLLFGGLFSLIERDNPQQSVSANLFILTVSCLLLVGGLLPQMIGPVTPMNVAALFLVLLTGYRLGVMEGATAGVAAGLILFGAANQGPAIMGILACGGMAAGLLRREKRLCVTVCFCAVCLSFGLLKGYPNLYLLVYEPVMASLVFLALPTRLLEKADGILARAGRDEANYQLLEKKRILSAMDEYRETFSYLALVYGPGKDGKRIPKGDMGSSGSRQERSGRSVASYQFAAIACALDDMMKDLRDVERPVLVREERFHLKTGTAGYARCENISGDSTLCSHIRKGEYLLALADGMGKGQRAAQESSLTLNTLHNLMRAGFEPELALRMINSLLLMKSTEEIFSTLDMGIVNLYTGQLNLYKIGAATTFIKRGDRVETVKASSLPLGMVEKISVDSIQVRLRRGDQIIIVSDGITEADRGRLRSTDAVLRQTGTESVALHQPTVGGSGGMGQTVVFQPVKNPGKSEAQEAEDTAADCIQEEADMDWSRIGASLRRTGRVTGEKEPAQFDWTIPDRAEETGSVMTCPSWEKEGAESREEEAEAMAERIRIRNHCLQRSLPEKQGYGRKNGDIHEEWLKETISQIKSTDPQTVSDLILNKAVERCGLREKDDMTVITACIY